CAFQGVTSRTFGKISVALTPARNYTFPTANTRNELDKEHHTATIFVGFRDFVAKSFATCSFCAFSAPSVTDRRGGCWYCGGEPSSTIRILWLRPSMTN